VERRLRSSPISSGDCRARWVCALLITYYLLLITYYLLLITYYLLLIAHKLPAPPSALRRGLAGFSPVSSSLTPSGFSPVSSSLTPSPPLPSPPLPDLRVSCPAVGPLLPLYVILSPFFLSGY